MGVGALASATRSTNVLSISCPTAEMMGILESNIALTNISSLNGLENITSVRNLIMIDNDNLTDISALNNLTSIQSTLRLPNNNYTVKINGGSYVCNEGLSKVRLGWTTSAPNRTDICTY